MKYIMLLVGTLATYSFALAEDSTTASLIKQAEYLQHRHEVLAQNVANVSTPGYIAQDLERPEILSPKNNKVRIQKVRLKTTNSKHLNGEKEKNHKYSVVLDKESPMKPNKNNVDIAKQATNIAQNTDENSMALKNYRSAIDLISSASGSGGQ